MIKFLCKNGHKGQIYVALLSKNTYHEEYNLCGKFHGFIKMCTIFALCHYTMKKDKCNKEATMPGMGYL